MTTAAVLAWDGGWLPLQWDGWPWLSSAVHVAADGQVTAGQQAWLAAVSSPAGFEPSPVRRAGQDQLVVAGTQLPAVDLVAATLRVVGQEAARVAGGPVADVRLVVPAVWGPTRLTWLRQAARRAGLAEVTLVPAPVAVAQHLTISGVQLPVGSYLAVCDLGGGVKVNVLRRGPAGFEVLSFADDESAGGSRIDELLAAQLNGHQPETAAAVDGRWQVVAAVRAAKEAASGYATVTVGSPPTVWTAGQVQQVARPVLEQAAQQVVKAVEAADLTPDRLAGVFLAGGGASMPLAGQVMGEAVGRAPVVVADPGVAAVRGAAQATGPQGGAGVPVAAGPPLPPLRRALSLAVPGFASLLVLARLLMVKDRAEGPYNWYQFYQRSWNGDVYALPVNWGALALAATLAVVACLCGAALIASVLPYAVGPAGAAGSDGGQMAAGLLVAAGLGVSVAGVYAVGVSLYFRAPSGAYLRWALVPVLPLLAVVVAVAALAARWGRRPAVGWHDWLGFPVSSVVPAAVGMVLVDYAYGNSAAGGWDGLLGRFGGLLIGVGAALALVRPLLLRLVLAGPVGVAAAAITDWRTTGVLAVIYIAAVTLWWLQRLWQLWTGPPRQWLPGT
ncbi:Hsp70 family protein [Phytohabitans sp. LJ34]|uniref:Hsp70 family protein n=1 Tax=Phytohabitans sp. LJ34 TaxID=3452217 RepID=UPI003F8B4C67